MKAFISHISEESAIAACLKGWLESTWAGGEVFVSSEAAALPAGTKWLDEILRQLDEATVLFVICSQASLHRPWVNFETGYAWARKIPVIPLCHGGMRGSSMPPPIGVIQGLDMERADFPALLFQALKAHLKLPRAPRVHEEDAKNFARDLASALSKDGGTALAAPSSTRKGSTTSNGRRVLECLATDGVDEAPVTAIAEMLGWRIMKTQFELGELEAADLVSVYARRGEVVYAVTQQGLRVLAALGWEG